MELDEMKSIRDFNRIYSGSLKMSNILMGFVAFICLVPNNGSPNIYSLFFGFFMVCWIFYNNFIKPHIWVKSENKKIKYRNEQLKQLNLHKILLEDDKYS